MARPPLEIDMQKLAAMMRLKPTAEDCAAFFKCSVDTIERRIREHTVSDDKPEGMSFAEFRDQNMVHTRFSLIRKAIAKGEAGDNVMLIFCLKNLCGWRDKQPDESEVVINNNINSLTEEMLDAKIAQLEKKLKGEE